MIKNDANRLSKIIAKPRLKTSLKERVLGGKTRLGKSCEGCFASSRLLGLKKALLGALMVANLELDKVLQGVSRTMN